jgi:CheY-like chemotaxis protein
MRAIWTGSPWVPYRHAEGEAVVQDSVPPCQGTVLLVDDEEVVLAIGRQLLEKAGFDVLTAGTGQEAVDIFREQARDIGCVLLDLTMPDMSGQETYEELRVIRDDVRIVIASGYTQDTVQKQIPDADPACFLQKPYLYDSLTAVMARAMA